MNYENIPGWFDFKNVYQEVVNKTEDNAVFVEVGAWYGKSTVCMAELIKLSGKHIQFTTVDDWSGVTSVDGFREDVYNAFIENLKKYNVTVAVLRANSITAAYATKDGSCDFIFLDGNHSYDSVKADIEAWLPKVKRGGMIGGHDYTDKHSGVKHAVQETFKEFRVIGNSWLAERNTVA